MNTNLANDSRSRGTGKAETEAGRYDINGVMEPTARRPQCPCCRSSAYRIKRRFIDLVISLFAKVHRYRCRSRNCGWEGNFRVKDLAPQGESRAKMYQGDDRILEGSRMNPISPTERVRH